MNTPTKIVLYVVLSIAAIYFGKNFYRDYQRANAAATPIELSGDPMDVDVPTYGTELPEGDSEIPVQPEDVQVDANTEDVNNGALNATLAETGSTETLPDTPTETSSTESEASSELPPPRLGFYGGGFMILMLCLGLLGAMDITQFLGKGAVDTLFNDDNVGTTDDEYENAEAEWQKGDYLEAIRLMREYLANNPRQIHAALRIAEIYEKDLNNPLAAALEYEEILNQKLPRERWGWAAIHLANIYSGALEKPDQAIALLRRLVDEYGDTQAAEKARKRLAMIDGTAPPAEESA